MGYFVGWTYTEDGDLIRPCGTRCSRIPDGRGYLRVSYRNKSYKQHRIIFYLCYGYWPELVDHKDQNKLNNRPSNLRDATVSENQHNKQAHKTSTAGIKGYYLSRSRFYCTNTGKR